LKSEAFHFFERPFLRLRQRFTFVTALGEAAIARCGAARVPELERFGRRLLGACAGRIFCIGNGGRSL
jgi:hypothetical protein